MQYLTHLASAHFGARLLNQRSIGEQLKIVGGSIGEGLGQIPEAAGRTPETAAEVVGTTAKTAIDGGAAMVKKATNLGKEHNKTPDSDPDNKKGKK
ncbi:hypothetical protein H6771_01655 [Candidatus Peribacteria bacterium]|nr:hypothetical protein [Candidatus Peribacteria bacterium]